MKTFSGELEFSDFKYTKTIGSDFYYYSFKTGDYEINILPLRVYEVEVELYKIEKGKYNIIGKPIIAKRLDGSFKLALKAAQKLYDKIKEEQAA